jgi:hypothetical protein
MDCTEYVQYILANASSRGVMGGILVLLILFIEDQQGGGK